MLRIILGVIVGFIVWSIVWVGTNAIFAALSPDVFGKNIREFQEAFDKNLPYSPPLWVTFFLLCLASLCSIIAGFTAVLIAGEKRFAPIILGLLLLATGIFVEFTYWNYFPLWYHIFFLLLLIPMTIMSGKFRRV